MVQLIFILGEEGTSDGVLNVIHALVAAFDDLFPNVAMEDVISKVCVLILATFLFPIYLFVQFSLNKDNVSDTFA